MICFCMFVHGWPVLELRFGLLMLSFYPTGSFILRVKVRLIDARSMQNFDTFSVKFSVFKNFTSATVFSIKCPIFQYELTLTGSSISGIYRVLTSGYLKAWERSIVLNVESNSRRFPGNCCKMFVLFLLIEKIETWRRGKVLGLDVGSGCLITIYS